jgi:MFS family permease
MPEAARPLALRRISEEAGGLRVVLTSRPEEYAWAADFMRPWDNVAVRQRVAADLDEHPDGVAARTLDNPLTLTLAREAYTRRDPSELTDPAVFATAAALREYLTDQILVTAYRDEQDLAHAVRWLAWIAQRLGPSRDLPWWQIPAWIPLWQLRLARVVTIGLVAGLINGIALNIISALTTGFTGNLAIGLAANLAHGMATGLLFGLVFGVWPGRRLQPRKLAPRWPKLADLQRVFSDGPMMWVAIFLAFIWGVIGTVAFGPTAGLAVAAVVVLAAEFRNLWSIPSADSRSATASETYRADRWATAITGLALGLVMLLAGLSTDVPVGFTSPLANALANALPFGISVTVAAWLAVGQAPRVLFAEIILACQHHHRVRLMRLLEDAADRQVLRQAGVMYQFRHATLQDRLAFAYQLDGSQPGRLPRTQAGG